MHANDQSEQRTARSVGSLLAVLATPVIVLALLPWPLPDLDTAYVPLHTAMETASIAVAVVVFVIGWNGYQQRAPLPILVVSVAFLGVALLDTGHMLSINGMPAFITPSGEEKTIRFWLAARLLAALALTAIALLPWSGRPAGVFTRRAALMLTIIGVLGVYAIIVANAPWLPEMFDEEQGLTPVKIRLEYGVVVLHILSAIVLWSRRDRIPDVDVPSLVIATLTIGLSEVLFTLYTSVTDTFALVGHFYKAIAYYYLFRALAISGIAMPYRQLAQARAGLRATLESLPDMILEIDRGGVVHQFYSASPHTLVTPEDGIGRSLFELLPGNLRPVLQHLLDDVDRNGRSSPYNYELDVRGETRYFEAVGNRLDADANDAPRTIIVVQDVTRRRERDHERRIAAAAFESQESICVTDADHHILRVNSAFERVTGHAGEDILGLQPDFLLLPQDRTRILRAIKSGIERRGRWRGEVRLQRKDGETQAQLLLVSAVADETGRVHNYIYDYIDISALKKAEDRLERLALYDPLTGLGNRRLLERRLAEAVEQDRQSGQFGCLMLINLIGFKRINDAMGFGAGDQLLIECGQELRRLAGKRGIAYRQGADEFALILSDLGSNWEGAIARVSTVADRVFSALDRAFRINEEDYFNRCRIGVSVIDPETTDSAEVLNQAAIALHQVKHLPDRTFSFFDPRMQEAVAQEQSLEADLRRAIREEEFELYFQPKVDRDRRMVGAEALIRWHHPERGLVPPHEFIPAAEQSGLITPIEKWTLAQAAAQLERWSGNLVFSEWTLSVNVASSQLYRNDFESHLVDLFERHAIKRHQLIIELTESTLLDDVHAARERISRLTERGLAFSIDDFGTGYSSLAYLGRLPVHELKIDRSFVREIDNDDFNADIIRMTLDMATILELNVVAEGVETEDQVQRLLELGCPVLQGFLFGRPMRVADLEDLALKTARPA
jgi:diguanylate cyclase (GGDEF)-like protein/PAS domain S-box-containing protein